MYNEKEVFTKASVKELLLKHELVQLDTNEEPNQAIFADRFRGESNPLYVVLEPTPTAYREIARYTEGRIENVSGFIDFLKAPATIDFVDFKIINLPNSVRPGQVFQVVIEGTLKKDHFTFPLTERTSSQDVKKISKLEPPGSTDLRTVWPVKETEPELIKDSNLGMVLVHKKPFTWTVDVFVKPDVKPGETPLAFSVSLTVTKEGATGTNGSHYFSFPLKVEGEKLAVSKELQDRLDQAMPPKPRIRAVPGDEQKVTFEKGPKPATAELIEFDVKVEPSRIRRGDVAKLVVTGKLKGSNHTYPLTVRSKQQNTNQLSKLTIQENKNLVPLWPVRETEPEFVKEGKETLLEHKKPFTWTQDIYVPADATPGKTLLEFSARVQVCDKTCVWGTHSFAYPIDITAEAPGEKSAEIQARLDQKPTEPSVLNPSGSLVPQKPVKKPGAKVSAKTPASDESKDSGLLAFMLQGVFWGAVSLVTPCVFPMIPITVSFFLKKSEQHDSRPLLHALVYALTIILVLTTASVALLSFFRALSTNPIANFIIGGLFIFFALSLFGMYDIQLPSGLARFTASREGEGLVGTIFMALTFTIISFTCVAPFLGGFGGTAALNELGYTKMIFGGLAFATTFASPFVVLALFPTLLRKLPKGGGWMNAVKVVMGFLEMAAALKFFRAAELVYSSEPKFFTYEFVMALYISLSGLCGLYLLGFYRLHHDTPVEHITAPRMLLASFFIGLSIYLAPSLFKVSVTEASEEEGGEPQTRVENIRPSGVIFAWLNSFLLPDSKTLHHGWLEDALAAAKDKGKRVLIDFTGETCTNCKYNEENIFTRPDIRKLLAQYEIAQLYTDIIPRRFYIGERELTDGVSQQTSDAEANLKFQREKFNDEQLPLYVIVEPAENGQGWREIARYKEGKINNIQAFIDFLTQHAEPDGQ